jgi:hypothetical protein
MNLWIFGRVSWTGDQPDARPLPTNRATQQRKTRTHIRALSGIRTHDPSVRAVEHSTWPRPRDHWNRLEGLLGEWRYGSTHSLTSALEGGEWSASHPDRFIPSERSPGTHRIGGWVDPRAGLVAVVKRKIPSPCQDSKPRSSSPYPSAIPTELSRLLTKDKSVFSLRSVSVVRWAD